MKIILFVPTFLDGGVEKIFTVIAKTLVKNNVVEFLIPGSIDKNYTKQIDYCNFISLGVTKSYGEGKVILSLIPLIKYLKNSNAEYIIAAPGYSTLIILLAKLIARKNIKTILVIDIKLSTFYKSKKIYQKLLPFFARILYRYADYIIVSYKQVEHELISFFGVHSSRVETIYPPMIMSDIEQKADLPVQEKWFLNNKYKIIIGVGRLVKEKDFKTLIESFAIIHNQDENFRLVILGQGEEENNLKNLVNELHLNEYIAFYGYQENPYKYIKRSDVLVVSSEWEAFGITIVESLALGTQVVVTDVQSEGPQEIIDFGKYGFITKIGDAKLMAEAILHSIKKPIQPELLQNRAKDFNFNMNSQKYESVIEHV